MFNCLKGTPMRTFRSRKNRVRLGWYLDSLIKVRSKRIVFVTKHNVQLMGNLRIMLDAIVREGGYEVALFQEGEVNPSIRSYLTDNGVRIFNSYDFAALKYIYSSEIIVLSHSARDAYISKRKLGRRVVNLWHGVALKRIERLMPVYEDNLASKARQEQISRNAEIYDAMVAAGKIDQRVNAMSFGLSYDQVHAIGLPRFDYLKQDYEWPRDLVYSQQKLKELLGGRKLIVYAPTFRENGISLDELLVPKVLEHLKLLCLEQNVVVGIRPHPYEVDLLGTICDGESILNLSPEEYPESAIVLDIADMIIVDYSSIWVDFLLKNRPILGFMPDYDAYVNGDRGFNYNYKQIFPGPIFDQWDTLISGIRTTLEAGLPCDSQSKIESTRALFLEHDEPHRLASERCLKDVICV